MTSKMKLLILGVFTAFLGLSVATAANRPAALSQHPIDAVKNLPGGIGALEAPPEDPENPSTPAKIRLGHLLFFDTKLSGDNTLSCASCHLPEKAFADGERNSVGSGGKRLPRHTPTVLNSTYN